MCPWVTKLKITKLKHTPISLSSRNWKPEREMIDDRKMQHQHRISIQLGYSLCFVARSHFWCTWFKEERLYGVNMVFFNISPQSEKCVNSQEWKLDSPGSLHTTVLLHNWKSQVQQIHAMNGLLTRIWLKKYFWGNEFSLLTCLLFFIVSSQTSWNAYLFSFCPFS